MAEIGGWCGFEEGVMADVKSLAKLKASLLREFHLRQELLEARIGMDGIESGILA